MDNPIDSGRTNFESIGSRPLRILCYSPYNLWALHGMWEMTILHALKLRGAELRYVLCDGLYSDCDVFWASTNPRHSLSCTHCQAEVTSLVNNMGMRFEWLGRYLTPDDFREASLWTTALKIEDFVTAKYRDWNIGEWVKSSVHSHFRMSHPDFSSQGVQRGYRSYLYSGLVACLGLSRLLDEYKPDALFLFNGRQSSTRVALELAMQSGVRVICHERGWLSESLRLSENVNCLSLRPIKQIWEDWGHIPLRKTELETITQHMCEREHGKNLGWRAFSPPPQDLTKLLAKLGLRADLPVWVLFTSSDDEVVGTDDLAGPFDRQLHWLQQTIAYMEQHPQVELVIRVHPNTGGKKATGCNIRQLEEIEQLRPHLPQNVRLVMPDDPISSYSLMDIATLGLVYSSTVGLEMACKGKHVLVAAGSIVSDLPFVQTLKSVKEYGATLNTLLDLPLMAFSVEIQRMAYRFAYGLFFRWNIPFPMVKMPDPHTGQLAYSSLDHLLPGCEPNLDRICRVILEKEPVCLPPRTEDRLRSEEDESKWFEDRLEAIRRLSRGHSVNRKLFPLVSVVIPCYNYARYLPEAVNSVLGQTLRDFEIIIINDGSTDNTKKVAEKLIAKNPNRQIRLINQSNSGQPAISRNRGISKSEGEYILPLDGDDMISPTMLEDCVNLLEKDKSIAIAYTDRLDFDGVDQVVQAGDYDFRRLKFANHISYCAVFRRQVWEKVGGYRTNVKGCEDWDFWVAAGARGYFGRRIPKPLFKYRRHDTGVYQEVLCNFNKKFAQLVLNNREVYGPNNIAAAQTLLSNCYHRQSVTNPMVSVIIPTFNRPHQLSEALASLEAQTFRNFEVLVINDGGIDVDPILRVFRDKLTIEYIRHAMNLDRSAARNSGLRAARGKYVAYLDDDDIFYPYHLETLVRFLEASPHKVAYTDAFRAHQVKENGKYAVRKRDVPYSLDFDYDRILVGNFIPVLCVMHERSCLVQVGLFDETLTSHEDWDLWIRLSRKFEFAHIKKVTAEFAWRSDGSTTTSAMGKDFLRTAEIIYEKCREHTKDKPHILEAQRQSVQWRRSALSGLPKGVLCSIIIPVFNRLEYTKQCLKTLAENTPNDLYEVIIVDNGSSDGSKNFLKCLEGHVKTVSNKENVGFARACNQGAALAAGKYLVFLNNDTEPQPGWLGEMVKTAEEDPRIGVVGSRLLYPDRTVQHAGIYFEEHGIPYHAFRGFSKDHPAVLEVTKCPAVTGACLLIAKDLFERLRGFDEGYQMYVEDVDLCLRAWEAGFRVAYCGASVVIHYESASVTDIAQRDAQVRKGWSRLLERWANRWPLGLQPHLQLASSEQSVMAVRAVANDDTANMPQLLWQAPIFDPSGYANEARHFILQLGKQGFEVAARPIGRYSAGFRSQLESVIRGELDRALDREIKPDFISVVHFPAYGCERLPQASYNIGRTTFETDSLPTEWVERCNQMDEVWIPSEFNMETFRAAGVTTTLFKVPEGIDAERFRPGCSPLSIPGADGFVFLSVFEWIYRKGWDSLLRAWAKAFDPCEKVTLVLRTYPINAADLSQGSQEIERRIDLFLENELGLSRGDVAPIMVLGDQIPEADMPRLYASASAYVAPSRGEGWGRPQMEAMACGLPVIATRWGGNLEFMNDENSFLIGIEGLVEIDDRAEIAFYRGQRWAEPSVDHLVSLLRHLYKQPAEGLAMGKRAREDMVRRWTWEKVVAIAARRLKRIQAKLLERREALSSAQTKKALSVRWEGSQFVHHSLALINRELCLRLIDAGCEVSIIPYEPNQFDVRLDQRFQKLAKRVAAPLSRAADVHIRHQWPPNFEPPAEGHWIMIQPWEFGSLPKRWVEVMRSEVDDVWVPSHYLRECYVRSGIPDDRVHVIPNGVNVDKFRPDATPVLLETKKRFKFLFVGGTIWRKGADLLLDAYLKMFSADDDVCLVIKDMGGNSFYKGQTSAARIRKIQAQHDSPEILYLTENMAPNDLPGLYTACDCLVQPYRGEGFGLPIAEAMACGLPVIVTNHGAALDFCNEENAYLVPAVESRFSERRVGDIETVDYPWLAEPDLEALSRLMRRVFNDPVGGRQKGQRGRAFVADNLTWEKVVQEVLERVTVLRARPIRRYPIPDRHFRRVCPNRSTVLHDPHERLRAGEEALHEGHDQEAEQIFKNVLKDDPRNPQAHNNLACVLWQTGRVEEALQELTEAMKIAPHDGDVIWNCGQILTELGFLQDALGLYRDFVKNHPDKPEFSEAIHSLEGRLNETDGTAHAGRNLVEQGEHLFRQGKVDEAIGFFKEALKVSPDLAVAHNDLASAYHCKGEVDNAIQPLISAMKLAPDDSDVMWNCGQILIELGYLKDALEVYKDLLKKRPDDLRFTVAVRDLVDSLSNDNLVAVESKAERTPIVSAASNQ